MGRTKTSGGGIASKYVNPGSQSPASSEVSNSSSATSAESRIKEVLKELYYLIHQVQEERSRGEHNLTNISKTHERMQQEQKTTPYYKNKLRGLYNTAMQDAEGEAELLRKALDKIVEIKAIRENRRQDSDCPKPIMRRGVLMTILQQNAVTLPLWVSKPGEKPPPLCGAVPADNSYVAKPGDKVAARVKSSDGEENWILAEVVTFNTTINKYEVDDIDAEEGKEQHVLSKRKVVPLPIWKASPETDPEALFPRDTLVLALYPQTTCFYRALIHMPPKKPWMRSHGTSNSYTMGCPPVRGDNPRALASGLSYVQPQDDYSVLFEDTSYPDGYSPPLMVAQRYVILCKEDKKK